MSSYVVSVTRKLRPSIHDGGGRAEIAVRLVAIERDHRFATVFNRFKNLSRIPSLNRLAHIGARLSIVL